MARKRIASTRSLHKHRARLAGQIVSGVLSSSASYVGTVVRLLAKGQLTALARYVRVQGESLHEPYNLNEDPGLLPDPERSLRAHRNNLWHAAYRGNFTDAVSFFAQADSLEDSAIRAQGLEPGDLRLLGGSITASIGHSAVGLAARARLSAFGQNPTDRYLLLSGGAANVEYLRFWSRYFPLVETSAAESRAIEHAFWPMMEGFHTVRTNDGSIDVRTIDSQTAIQWEAEGREPLLRLEEQDFERGYAPLAKFGLARSDWFVCLHIRQSPVDKPGYARNAAVESYIPAINSITEAGGFVMRIGADHTTPLPTQDRVIDLAHHKPYEPWLDVFSIAASRFMIATTSGPMHVAPTFGVPVLATNQTAIGTAGYLAQSLVLPKRMQLGDAAPLNQRQMLASLLGFSGSYIQDLTDEQGRSGYHWVDNSAQEIKAGVQEMLAGWQAQESDKQAAWRQGLIEAGNPGSSRIAQSFLDLNPDLL
ncbi:MAG: TIGR04372 family glycosyltransferase [Actinomycetota bacterium]|nr:TIGR04372 family glycosyltransferase [Actinomycetota bacterium]